MGGAQEELGVGGALVGGWIWRGGWLLLETMEFVGSAGLGGIPRKTEWRRRTETEGNGLGFVKKGRDSYKYHVG